MQDIRFDDIDALRARISDDFGPWGEGLWFEHSALYSIAVTMLLDDIRVAPAPGRPKGSYLVREHGGKAVVFSDYFLTNTLYADPKFFRWETQIGPDQFRAQRLGDILFPSDKGILSQGAMFHYSEYGVVHACCAVDLPAPVVFADLSASEHVMRRMPPGIMNLYSNVVIAPGVNPREMRGPPVLDTVDGIRGRDRVRAK